jgi:hypothetical protein
MNADTARSTYGIDGSGITLGVISDSFNNTGVGNVNAQIAAGDLPGAGNSQRLHHAG